ncbi:carbamoyl phosphate synthase-like protein [Botrimarina colliarenosi]|uniref:Carbamoyl phosphate synthase-like protein n=1 Tax=Botrimarina colliarenosi TaxID=2528001 RepID=A0A5C6A9U4_9BACT|nr:ATP-grasp domain-containing protein [Botrimarina colliarenosi]TWT96088.1 carbamoyl phosphate synthase-like protein [Botrimarina colliarenosi]
MRLLIYEWVTGGGLVGSEGALPDSLLREGLAMVQAVTADAAGIEGVRPTVLRDLRLPHLATSGADVIEVASRADHDAALFEAASQTDGVLVIAPETDGVLLRTVLRLEANRVPLLSPGSAFVAVAADKEQTGAALMAAGVAVPQAVRIESDTPLPTDFPYPAVLKPIDGAGSQDTHVVAHASDQPPAYAWPRRLERYTPGVAASVAVIGVAGAEPLPLPPCRQRLSSDGRLAYLGGSTPLAPGLAERATGLALRAVAALPPLIGWAGVDLILGDDPDGSLDVVIEVNPRLTTSYVGLRRVTAGGLAGAMIAAARGDRPHFDFNPRPLAFDADGAVYWT